MNYQKILTCDMANGLGLRVTLFVSGCGRKCPGCFNPESWSPVSGKPFTDVEKQAIFAELARPEITGFSVLGGEPMSVMSDNRRTVIALLKEIKERFPEKDVWMWSGYKMEELKMYSETKEVLEYIDVLCDGPFVQELHDPDLAWVGSSNQRVLRKGRDF